METKQAKFSYRIVMENDSKSCDLNAQLELSLAKQWLDEELIVPK